MVTLAAVAVSCIVPRAMLPQTPPAAGGVAIVTGATPAPSGSECAAIACNRGSASSSVPLRSLGLAGLILAGALVVLALCAALRRSSVPALSAGSPFPLYRPPQPIFAA